MDADEVAPLRDRTGEREELKRQVAAFLAKGGKVARVPFGTSAEHGTPRERRDASIRKAFLKGMAGTEIAAKSGVSRRTVTRACAGLARPRSAESLRRRKLAWSMRKAGCNADTVAEELGVTASAVFQMWREVNGGPVDKTSAYKTERNAKVWDEYLAGVKVAEIAGTHGIPQSRVRPIVASEARRRGVEAPRRMPPRSASA